MEPISKHVQKTGRVTVISPFAAGAIRLLLFTGCRLREILNLRWTEVDFDRMLHLPDSKTGKKSIVLNPLPSPSSPRCPSLATMSSTATVQRSLDRI
jgi:integrase